MADNTKIEWTEATWNPITGCSLASPGCTNCYAMQLAGTRLAHHESRAGLTQDSKAGPVWTGEVRFNEQWLDQPLRWTKPRMIFVCAHGDLFHESVPDAWIDKVFAIMALAQHHTFQVLTKRSARMRDYCISRFGGWGEMLLTDAIEALGGFDQDGGGEWGKPLPNVWLGVSVEDQQRADERIPDLLATPAAVRWISAEPLLGPVELTCMASSRFMASQQIEQPGTYDALGGSWWPCLGDFETEYRQRCEGLPRLDWVVVGGESGSKARPMHPDWARTLRDQCATAGVPFFFKQWGEFRPRENEDWDFRGEEATVLPDGTVRQWRPDFPRARLVHPQMRPMIRVGKKRAGRLLDGIEHNGMPQ